MYELEQVTVTPELAVEWGAKRPQHQRRLNAAYVKRLAADLESGRFRQSPQPFILDENDQLLDGQHRAAAVALSGVALESAVVVRGVPSGMFGQIDIGLRRTPAQFLDMPYSSLIAGACRLILLYEIDHRMVDIGKRGRAITINQIVEEVDRRPLLPVFAGQVALVANAAHIHGPTLLAVTVLGAATQYDLVDSWLNGLNTGADLSVGDARLTLRNTFTANYKVLNRSNDSRRAWAYVVKAWNAYVNDEEVKILRFTAGAKGQKLGGARGEPAGGGTPMPRIIGS